MRILGDSQITNADITATSIVSTALTNKLKTFQLTDNMRTLSNTTQIDIVYNGTVPDVNAIGLCGTNLTPSSVVTVSYSNTNIESPDASVVLSKFSTLNQIMYFATSLNKKYWRIAITDTGNSLLFIGYIYMGEYFQVPLVKFGHSAALDIFSNSSVTNTGQGYGSKIYNSLPVEFTMYANYADLAKYLTIVQEKQDIDPVLIVEYEESYDQDLYRPKYGILSNTTTPFATSGTNYAYEISVRLEERF